MGGPMELPLYVKIIALVGAVAVIFLLAAWELVKDWFAGVSAAVFRFILRRAKKAGKTLSEAGSPPQKPTLPKPV